MTAAAGNRDAGGAIPRRRVVGRLARMPRLAPAKAAETRENKRFSPCRPAAAGRFMNNQGTRCARAWIG